MLCSPDCAEFEPLIRAIEIFKLIRSGLIGVRFLYGLLQKQKAFSEKLKAFLLFVAFTKNIPSKDGAASPIAIGTPTIG